PGHLSCRGCDATCYVFMINQVQEFTVLICKGRSKMSIHLPSCTMRLIVFIGVGIQLRKKFFYRSRFRCEGNGLISVIPSIKISRLKKFRQGYLRYFFTIAEDAEFCFSCQHFFTTQQTGFPAFTGKAVIAQHFFTEAIKRKFFFGQNIVGNDVLHKRKNTRKLFKWYRLVHSGEKWCIGAGCCLNNAKTSYLCATF